tara:strand:+ start:838 stop:1182 length:345 start_codon:yes stop_codon:yes gene_type:complete
LKDCIFCKIANNVIDVNKVYENKDLIAFNDMNPQAPFHILIIPKKHISTINDIKNTDKRLIGELFIAAKKIAYKNKISDSGYRLIFNCNENGGQTVFHIHLHMLAKRKMSWPPG